MLHGRWSSAGASPTPTIHELDKPIRRIVGATLAVALALALAVALVLAVALALAATLAFCWRPKGAAFTCWMIHVYLTPTMAPDWETFISLKEIDTHGR